MKLPVRQDTAWVTLVWIAVGFVTAFSIVLSRSYLLTSIGDLTQCSLLTSAFILCCSNARVSKGRAHLFWLQMVLGIGFWLLAQVLWTYFEVFRHREVPNPFVGDVILFLHLVPLMGALAIQPDRERNEEFRKLGAIDFLLLLVWWLYLYCFVVIPWQYIRPDEAAYGGNFDLIYLFEHAVLLIIAGSLWVRSTRGWRVIYGHVFGASLLYAIGSVAASVAIDFGQYYTGSLYDVPLVVAMAWFSVMVLGARRLTFVHGSENIDTKRSGNWIAWLATSAMLSLPLLAAWAQFGGRAPREVRSFRLLLTLATMMVMGAVLALRQFRLDKQLAIANEQLHEASLTDLLTGTKNRRFFVSSIDTDIQQVLRCFSSNNLLPQSNRDLIFYFIDIDHFKEINDEYGHEAGDQVLIEIARRISSAIRHSDILVRWGGEEFLVVSRYTNREQGEILANRILKAVGREPFVIANDRKTRTCSVGWAVFPWFTSEPESVNYQHVLRIADSALYKAKNSGRNKAIGMLPSNAAPSELQGGYSSEYLQALMLVTEGTEKPAVDDPVRARAIAASKTSS